MAFAAIVIGAFVPAAIMSIAAANLWTRNIYMPFINKNATPKDQARQSKLASLLVKFGALVFVLALPNEFAIYLQLLGGVWILQTLPAIVIGLYTRWLHRYALVINLVVAVLGTLILRSANVPRGTDQTHPSDYRADAGDPHVDVDVDPLQPVAGKPTGQ